MGVRKKQTLFAALMAYKNNEQNQETHNDQIWQNSIGYLEILQKLDVAINENLSVGNLEEVAQLLRQLIIFLERITKAKEANGRSKEFNSLMPAIKIVQEQILLTPRDARKQKREQFDSIENIYLNIGDWLYKLDLVFKQGIDPIDAWALQ